MRVTASILVLLLASACATAPAPAPVTVAIAPPPAPTVDPAAEDARLLAFLDAAFDATVARSPQRLTGLGRKERYGELDDYTDAFAEETLKLRQQQLSAMRAQFDPARLSPAGRLSFALFEREVTQATDNWRWRWHFYRASTNGSPAGAFPVFMINQHRVASVADAEAYVSRLRAVERGMGEVADNMAQAAAKGIVPPTFNFAPVRGDAGRVLDGAPFKTGPDTPLWADFQAKVAKLDAPEAEKTRLLAEGRAALTGPVARGYRLFLDRWSAIERQASGVRGAWSLPEGEAYYAARLRDSTTTDLTAEQIHSLGLREVARIQQEMERVKARIGFQGSLRQFFDELRTNPKYQYPNTEAGREAYLADGRRYVAQVMAEAPKWFRRLPKAALEVRAVEKWREATASIAFYNAPSEDGTRPGIFYANLANMANVSRPAVEAISYHEGAPGHHFQIALAQELPGVPRFRRFGGYGAYAEGWGLYSEGLAKEMGFYQDPVNEFGMLSTQIWRAVRLVVDSGIHSKRWTREQAIEYFLANAALSRADATREVERYFNWPGQATSYMVGQLKILELRDKARRELGDRFDIRDFHGVVLENGSVPLDVLEQLVDGYIAEKKGALPQR